MNVRVIKNLEYGKYEDRIIRFLKENKQYTIFHDPKFLRYHLYSDNPISNYDFYDFIVEYSGNILFYLPGGIDTLNNTYVSHKGASFAGPVFSNHLSLKDKINLIKKILLCLKSKEIKKVIFKLTPEFYLSVKNKQDINWVLYELGFQEYKKDASVYLNIDQDISLETLSSNLRYDIKKSKKHEYNIYENTDLDVFYNILLENRKKFSALPTHTLADLKNIRQSTSPYFRFYILEFQNIPIAGMGTFEVTSEVINLFYPCHIREYSYLNPNKILTFEVINRLKKLDFKAVDFGPSNINDKELNHDLVSYKLRYGGEMGLRTSYFINLNDSLLTHSNE